MTIAVQGTTPDTFEIKSATLPLVALVLKSADLGALARELEARFGDIPDFFDRDAMVVDLSRLESEAPAGENPMIDFPALIELLRKYRLAPVAVRGGGAELTATALAAGLFAAPDARIGTAAPAGSNEAAVLAAAQAAVAAAAKAAVEAGLLPEPDARTGSNAEAAAQAATPIGALVIDKPLRSGQQVYARGRDLVVLAMVNAGAEVIADGHIHVYAPLRGRALAGARGNADARIFALSMEPELLSIAGLYRTGEAPLPAGVWGKPTQARLMTGPEGNRLVFDALK